MKVVMALESLRNRQSTVRFGEVSKGLQLMLSESSIFNQLNKVTGNRNRTQMLR